MFNTWVNEYDECYHDAPIVEICCTNDSKYVFTADETGFLKMFETDEKEMVHDFGEVHRGKLTAMCTDVNSRFLYTSDNMGSLKEFLIEKRACLKEFSG